MTQRVFKYVLPITDHVTIQIEQAADILTAQMQGADLCLWALVDPEMPKLPMHFRIAGTGHAIKEDSLEYISTIQLDGGALIFHIFRDHKIK